MQHTLEVEHDGAGYDPIYDANENVQEAKLLNLESDGPQEVSAQEHSDVQAALFDDTDNNILSRRRVTNIEYQEKIANLNDTQRVAFDSVVQYTHAGHQFFYGREKSHYTCLLQVELELARVITGNQQLNFGITQNMNSSDQISSKLRIIIKSVFVNPWLFENTNALFSYYKAHDQSEFDSVSQYYFRLWVTKVDECITARLFNEIGRTVTRQVWNSNLYLSLKLRRELFMSYSLHLVALGEQRLR